jgi:gamma-glutamylputrescine oxidase
VRRRPRGRNGGFLIAGLASFHHEAVARFGRTRAAALYRATAGELDRLAVAHPAIVRRTGSLRIAGDDRERHDCDAQLAAMRDDGLPAHRYDGDEGAGLLFPDDAAYDPLALCRAEADAVARAGGALFGQAPTEAIAPGFVQCATGSVRSRITLVCVDGGIETALPRLAGEARTARLQMLGTGPVAERRFPRPVYARRGLDYWQQLPDGRIALGGARDVGGDAEWTTSHATSEPVQRALDTILRERLRVDTVVTHRWAATVAFTRSGLPLLRELAPGLVACGAYNGTGNLMSRLCGRSALGLALGERSSLSELLHPHSG